MIKIFVWASCVLLELEDLLLRTCPVVQIEQNRVLEVQLCDFELVGELLPLGAADWYPCERRLFNCPFIAIIALIESDLVCEYHDELALQPRLDFRVVLAC